ncbi:MAG: hypothetical protein U0136_18175 [Bdellovibrionota bacterium]
MRTGSSAKAKITKEFIYFASTLSSSFPDLDLRFNLQNGTNRLRYTIPAVSSKVFELQLGQDEIDSLVHEATFEIKEITRRFDA